MSHMFKKTKVISNNEALNRVQKIISIKRKKKIEKGKTYQEQLLEKSLS